MQHGIQTCCDSKAWNVKEILKWTDTIYDKKKRREKKINQVN
jgi:hypothetical protein